jgi:hypothetical protein
MCFLCTSLPKPSYLIGSSILMAILKVLGEPNLVGGGGDKILWPHINSKSIGPKVAVGL